MTRAIAGAARRIRRVLAVLALASAPGLASAQFACTVTTSGADFGPYDIFQPAPTDTLAAVNVGCTLLPGANNSGGPIRFVLSATTGSAGRFSPWRQLANGAARLDYNLYTDFNRTTIWGDDTGGSVSISGRLGPLNRSRPTDQLTATIYARIRAQQVVPVGLYTDTLIVTMAF